MLKDFLKEKGTLTKAAGTILILLLTFDILPLNVEKVDELTVILSLILGTFFGKDIELYKIAKQLNLDRKVLKKHVNTNTIKDILK
jgi:hypothetical protein